MGIAHGGVGLEIKRASDNYYEFLDEALLPKKHDGVEAEAAAGRRYRVRVRLSGKPRSRALEVFAPSETAAGREALDAVGEGWSVIEIEEKLGD
jgi:hypothetical protein